MQDNSSLYSLTNSQTHQLQPQFPEQEHLKCPRCDSANTKFCYYNNYNLSQPRHFCKNCRRYWTKGGVLRNIPVGGGVRKNAKRTSSAAVAAAAKRPAAATAPLPAASNDKNGSSSCEMAETSPLEEHDFGGHFGNFSSLLLRSSGGEFVGGLLDGVGPSGSSLDVGDHFRDPGSGQNVDPRMGLESGDGGGFLNIHGGGGGGDTDECWSGDGNGWPDLAI